MGQRRRVRCDGGRVRVGARPGRRPRRDHGDFGGNIGKCRCHSGGTIGAWRSVALFRSTGGAGWVNKSNWQTDAPLRDWYGVTTDGAGRVIGLELESNNLAGSIPPDIEHLSELRRLIATTNTLRGKIPPEIGNLTRLERLMLRSNALSGPIPRQIGRLATMTTMGLDHNKLSGQIPAELGDLTRLAWLDLSANELAGEVPPELATTSLAALFVGGNLLRGPVPGSFLDSGIETFRAFQPTYRNLYLCVPGTTAFVAWAGKRAPNGRFCNASDQEALESLYQATDGEDWTDSDGWLSGPALGEWSGVETDSLGRVTALDLAGNELSGELPVPLGHLAAMTELKLGDNSLMGPLPLSLMSLSLRELRYAGTELCTPDDAAFRAWLKTIDVHEGTGVECAALTDRDILTHLYHATAGADWRNSDNWLSDSPLEDWHGVGVDDDGRVTSLNLHYNNLTGVIPPELGRLARLVELRLTSNPLTGPIPPELGDLANLRSLHLFFTQLTGEIPAELGQLSALEELWLQRMPLTGSIPPELGELSKLRFLALADCNLRGPIPPELGRLSKLERLYLLSNRLTGTIPPELGDLSRLILMNLSHNRLTGSIPDELGNLARLERVYLHNNGLTGRVPPNLGDLSSVDVLNLINNDLSGPLPATFGRLSKLEYFQVSNNAKMSGVLPGSLAIPRANGTVPGRRHGTLRAQLRGLPGMAGHRATLANLILPYGRPVACLPDAGRSIAEVPGTACCGRACTPPGLRDRPQADGGQDPTRAREVLPEWLGGSRDRHCGRIGGHSGGSGGRRAVEVGQRRGSGAAGAAGVGSGDRDRPGQHPGRRPGIAKAHSPDRPEDRGRDRDAHDAPDRPPIPLGGGAGLVDPGHHRRHDGTGHPPLGYSHIAPRWRLRGRGA